MSALTSESLADVARSERAADCLHAVEGPGALRGGDRIGTLRITSISGTTIEIRSAGELGFSRVLIGMVPILWCAAAWARCLREGWLGQRWESCLVLSAIALISAGMLLQSGPRRWRFERGRGVRVRAGALPLPGFWRFISAGRLSNLRIETIPATRFAGVRLRLGLMSHRGRADLEIACWPRAEIDRGQAEALGASVRQVMGWGSHSG